VTITIDVQYATARGKVPDRRKIRKWAMTCLAGANKDMEFTIRIVGEREACELNRKWRGKNKATNVLSFPAGHTRFAPGLLGDIILCAPIILREAREQNKQPNAHWAHMVIHGLLHLMGYDHTRKKDAEIMETIEIEKLQSLNYPNPYK
jgi:probable rRNA maturation factor